MSVKGTKKQHKELDADYRAFLLPPTELLAHHVNLNVIMAWREEKEYLSKYGRRYPPKFSDLARIKMAKKLRKQRRKSAKP